MCCVQAEGCLDEASKGDGRVTDERGRHGRQSDDLMEIKDGVFNCKLCSYMTEKRGNWYKHRTTHIGEQWLK